MVRAMAAGILVLTASQNAAADPGLERPEELQETIEVAYRQGDVSGLETARKGLLANAVTIGAGQAAYLAAYARFRQALASAADADTARGYLDECIGELRPVAEQNPANAEVHALLASCFGISTRYDRLGYARRGLEARRQMTAARKLAPQNPRVMLQDGLADEATPRLFGGDRERALRKLEAAARLFEAESASGSRLAAFGATEAWLQLGRMYRQAGRFADAARADERAEAADPLAEPRPQRLAAAF
jgi:tetratricopeptide (TPR) repeat protein